MSDELNKAIKQFAIPLFTLWSTKANLNKIEQKILFLKCFDTRNFNEMEQIEELQKKFDYYYDLRTYQNHWRKLKNKILKIL